MKKIGFIFLFLVTNLYAIDYHFTITEDIDVENNHKYASVPENTECIGNDVFSGCTNLKEVKIGSKLTEIMHGSFQGCTALETLDLPETVTKISDYAFKNCSPDLVLRCKEGSYVQQYAEAHGIKFEAVAE